MNLDSLKIIYDKFNNLFGHLGEIVIAGGAVRDYLIGEIPKDYDIYILTGNKENVIPVVINTEIRTILNKLNFQCVKAVKRNANYPREVEVVETVITENKIEIPDPKNAQIILAPYKTAEELISGFDWNICMFAYCSRGIISFEKIEDAIGKGKFMKLNRMNFPASNIRRGFRFSEKFGMKLREQDISDLAYALYCDLNKENEMI